ncbi:MAG: MerR family transcriptional regulator [Deltaproteobacteria bacterium]|nr:MerR family transcriptional regulator [Deltaproteobacteria bacterium]
MSEGNADDVSRVWEAVHKVDLPLKKYFKIGEVAQLVGVESHVLRYWQTQFPQVRPQKSRSGHRQYRRKDVETLLAVKELLHVQRFTIAGARQALRTAGKTRSQLPKKVGPETTTMRPPTPQQPLAERSAGLTELELVALEGQSLEQALEREHRAGQGPSTDLPFEVNSSFEGNSLEAKKGASEADVEPTFSALEAIEDPSPKNAQLGFSFGADQHAQLLAAIGEGEAILKCLQRAADLDARKASGLRRP